LKKSEGILVQHSEDIEAGGSDMEDCSCRSGATGCQAAFSPSKGGPIPDCGADSWEGAVTKWQDLRYNMQIKRILDIRRLK